MTTGTDLSDEILRSLRRIVRAIDLHSRVLAQSHGLTGPQALILKELTRLEDATVGQLAQKVSLSPATVTDIVSRLESRGFVTRTRSEQDKRRVLVKPTTTALEVLQSGPSLLQESFVAELETLAEWERTLILSSLQRIASMMSAETIPAAPVLAAGPLPPATVESQGSSESACIEADDESSAPTDIES
jgi:DNA-binding MarR family transcriptional regulator